MEKSYHHGNLREELIRVGIEIINTDGLENLSLRKAALICGVSHNAPFSHFQNKDEYLRAIKQYIEDEFSQALLQAVNSNGINEKVMIILAKTYINFFSENPTYFNFLLRQEDLNIKVSRNYIHAEKFKPFIIFQNTAQKILDGKGISKEKQAEIILNMWIMVQGLTTLFIMPGVEILDDKDSCLEGILKSSIKF